MLAPIFRAQVPRLLIFLAFGLRGPVSVLGVEAPDFSRDIQPILSDHCYHCHGPDEKRREGDLRLDSRDSAFRVVDGKALIAPGKSGESELFRRLITPDSEERMPPRDSGHTLTDRQIELIRNWIDAGAEWRQHWSFSAPRRAVLPSGGLPAGDNRHPLDVFLAAKLAREGLLRSGEADRRTLVRRVTLDLTGLPPTPEEVESFLQDESPNAYEQLVDRLLASPHFGERMVWDWLEAARYADSNGYQGDGERTMWPWRDWAVSAINANLPFDEFTRWQIAGDLLPEATVEQRLATGFCRNHMINGEGGRIAEENRIDYLMDMTETVGTVWLGLTLNCSRCHDHKYDPVSQREYYGLLAFFNQTPVDGGGGNPQTPPVLEVPSAGQQERRQRLRMELDAALKVAEMSEATALPRPEGKPASEAERAATVPDGPRKSLGEPIAKRKREDLEAVAKHFEGSQPEYAAAIRRYVGLQGELDQLQRAIPRVMVMEDRAERRSTFLLTKGLYNKPAEEVTTTVPHSMPALPADAALNRLALARWLTSSEHPLMARVAVNRLWQQFFGIGIVKTAEDFGVQGEPPVHPELLDWLAVEFRESGWDVKRLVRQLVTSATYRQASQATAAQLERDPDNRLLSRGVRYRWPSWLIRDQAVALSGRLVPTLGGPPVKPYQPPGVWEDATFGNKRYEQDHGAALYRRSVYVFWRRIVAPTMFFDVASRQTCVVKTTRTNTPLHALMTFNDPTYVEAARGMAERVLQSSAKTAEERVQRAFEWVLARPAKPEEVTIFVAGLTRLEQEFAADPASAAKFLGVGEAPRDAAIPDRVLASHTAFCLTLLNLDETLCKE